MRKRTIRAYVALALGFVLLPGCSGPIELAVTGEPMMNNGNPATVGIYQLSNNTRFMDATVTAFWAGDEEVLGDELVGTPQKLVVSPRGSDSLELKPDKEARYIGFAINYRRPDERGWRAIYEVSKIKGKRVRVTLAEFRLYVNVE